MFVVMVIFAALLLASAAGVVFSRRPLNSALWAVTSLFLVAAHYALLGAHFLAAIQILVYAGAIMVLVVFVIMLLGAEGQSLERVSVWQRAGAVAIGLVFLVLLCAVGINGLHIPAGGIAAPIEGGTKAVGKMLYEDYLFPFEIVSMLILTAIVGAVALGLEKQRPLKPGRGLKAKRSE